MDARLLDTKELSKMLGVTTNTLQIWRHEGKGPKYLKLSRRAVRYKEQDVLNWMESTAIETET
jgi:predicted DNA-binding transcriptional regulator AlpA